MYNGLWGNYKPISYITNVFRTQKLHEVSWIFIIIFGIFYLI